MSQYTARSCGSTEQHTQHIHVEGRQAFACFGHTPQPDHGLEGTRPACTVCSAHPGWAHDDESARREPLDCCAACFGSGVRQDLDAEVLLKRVEMLVARAREALLDESERDFRLAILRLANRAAALDNLVRTW